MILMWFTIACSLLTILMSLLTCVFVKATGDYRRGDLATRAVRFHEWTERVESAVRR